MQVEKNLEKSYNKRYQALLKIANLFGNMDWKHLWKGRKKSIPAQNAAVLFQFMAENVANVRKSRAIKPPLRRLKVK